ncbi:hypothetical protein EV356DRAFT_536096 [Viridothelium virens]|uniref:Mid2 domain-containing protein n=1 Tax=Viridothelium virens TaxID=1048519 RepID=A0A6A6GY40_VIRVR|nr:hypothetical protein EV356DRAFT_536096 [Viridothelium virens]
MPQGNLSACYYPDGSINSGDEPCDPDAEVSMCCSNTKQCLTNGLCALIDAASNTDINFARGTCTDETWQSEICPQHCRIDQDSAHNKSAYNFGDAGVQVWECGPGQGYTEPADYCRESEGEGLRCCSTSTAVFHLEAASWGNPSSTSATPTATATESNATSSTSSRPLLAPTTIGNATPTPTLSLPNAGSDRGSLNTGGRIGVGIGTTLSVLLLGVLAFLRLRKIRDKKSKRESGLQAQVTSGERKTELEASARPVRELDSTMQYEMDSEGRRRQRAWGIAELEASSGGPDPMQVHSL